MAAALSVLEVPGFTQYDLVPANWWFMGGACLGCLVVLAVRIRQLTKPE